MPNGSDLIIFFFSTGMDEAQLAAEVAAIDRKHIRDNSRSTYMQGIVKFAWWLLENKPDALTLGFRAEMPKSKEGALVHAKAWLEEEGKDCPFVFAELSVDLLKMYFASLRKKNGDKPGNAVYNHNTLFPQVPLHNIPCAAVARRGRTAQSVLQGRRL